VTQVLRGTRAAPTRLLQYELVRRVGMGGMGAVYLARDTDLGREVAVKLVHATWATDDDRAQVEERFLREARAAARLNHPHVAVVYQVGHDAGLTFIAMEWIDGVDLGKVAALGPLAWKDATVAVRDAASALGAAHARGLVHRDVKPSNLMRLHDGSIKLVDFGLARLHEAPSDLTMSGAVMGTPAYMAPELFMDREASPSTDLYALACTYFQLLTARLPFPGTHMMAVMNQHVGTPMPDPRSLVPDIPEAVARIVLRGAAKDAAQRYPHAAAMMADLQRALDEGSHEGSGAAAVMATVVAAPVSPPTGTVPVPSASPIGNLPAEVGAFIGRVEPATALAERLQQARLVTLTGPGGTGKTRLSQHVARRLASRFPDGVWLVELAALPVGGPASLAAAAVFGVRESADQGIEAALVRHLSDQRALLILDNCEHLIEPAAALAASLLGGCPQLTLLATSRQPLGVPGEATLSLPPMAVADDQTPVQALADVESVRLFSERARAASTGFVCEGETASIVAQICRRLDGIPLAIELAAARVKVLAPRQIAARLDDAFKLLSAGPRTLLPRQQTLQALIDWSWDLLADDERRAFARCSVFAGEFSIEAAEAVLVAAGDEPPSDPLDMLASLIDKSLLVAVARDGEMRYAMLQTLQAYAAHRLDPESALAARRRHAQYYAEHLAQAWKGVDTANHAAAMAIVKREHEQARSALESASQQRWFDIALPLGNLLANYWNLAGVLVDGLARVSRLLDQQPPAGSETAALLRRGADLAVRCGRLQSAHDWLQAGLDMARAGGDEVTAGRLLNSLGSLAYSQGQYEVAAQRFGDYLTLSRERGDLDGQIRGVNNVAIALRRLGRPDEARQHFQAALEQLRTMPNQRLLAFLHVNLGDLEEEDGRPAEARGHYEACLAVVSALDDQWGIALAHAGLGKCALAAGALGEARRELQMALAMLRKLGEQATIAEALDQLARVEHLAGRRDEAAAYAAEAMQMRIEAVSLPDIAASFDTWARLLADDHAEQAARLLGCAAAVRQSQRSPLESARQRDEQVLRTTLKLRVGAQDFECACALGAASDPMTLARTLAATPPANARSQRR
jgi:non-specific serine/threonine protein kinase